jgi:MFS family permease
MVGLGLLAISYGLLGNLTSIWQFFIILGVFGGIGASMVGVVPAQSLVSRWFDKNLGTALSVAYAGQGLGSFNYGSDITNLIDNVGWQLSYRIYLIYFCFSINYSINSSLE